MGVGINGRLGGNVKEKGKRVGYGIGDRVRRAGLEVEVG